MTKSTAAAPSLSRLSLSTSSRMRPLIRLSLNIAMIATGSVAAISAPNSIAEKRGQSSNVVIDAATTAAETTVPIPASASKGSESRTSSRQDRVSAASNRSGGKTRSKIRS